MPPSASGHESSGCWAFSQHVLAAVLADVQPGDVVLVHNYFRSHFGVGEDSRSMQLDGAGRHIVAEAEKLAYFRRALGSLADGLAARGASLLILEDAPRFLALKLPDTLCVKQWFRPRLPSACLEPLHQTLAEHAVDHHALHRMFRSVETAHANVLLLNPAATLCVGGICRTHDLQGQRLYIDRDHLSGRAVLSLAGPLEDLLRNRGLLPRPAPG